jgi:hypothetical protein
MKTRKDFNVGPSRSLVYVGKFEIQTTSKCSLLSDHTRCSERSAVGYFIFMGGGVVI